MPLCKKKKEYKPTHAITDAKYATIFEGRRLVRRYVSGEKLQGVIEN